MIIKEFRGKATDGRTRDLIELSCDNCQKRVVRQKRYLASYKGKHWCSTECMSLIKGTKQKVVCAHCNTSFIKKTSGMISKSGLHFCTRACKDEAQKYMTEIQPDHYGSSKAYRTKALEFYGPVCNRCGYNDNVAALVVHHIDRDRDNNELANLEVLCSNCHAIEHYGGSR